MTKEYIFEKIGTVLTVSDDGQIKLVYGRPADTGEDVYDQAIWVGNILDNAHKQYPKKKQRILVDLEKLSKITLSQKSREIYKKIIKRKYISQVAISGSALSYPKVSALLINNPLKKKKIDFFPNYEKAKKWLKWEKN